MVRLANTHSDKSHINIFAPDLHSIIADIDGELQPNIIRSFKYYLAAGFKHERTHSFLSSVTRSGSFRTLLDFKLRC